MARTLTHTSTLPLEDFSCSTTFLDLHVEGLNIVRPIFQSSLPEQVQEVGVVVHTVMH